MKIMKVTGCALIAWATFALGQDHPRVSALRTPVFVSAEGKFESAPDTALIQFNISVQADSAKAAYDQAAKEAETTRQVLRANGIDPKAAEIGFFSLNPQYDWKNPNPKPIAYQVTTTHT